MLTSLTVTPGLHMLETVTGTRYLVTIHADGTGLATQSPEAADSHTFRFARLVLGLVGDAPHFNLHASFHGYCAPDRNPVEFDTPGRRILSTSAVTAFDLV